MRHNIRAGIWGAAVAAVIATALSILAQPPLTSIEELELDTALAPEYGGVPAGAVIFVAAASCPAGYSEYTTAQGRYVVGVPADGTVSATQGTALSNLQSRTAGLHGHYVGSHTHAFDGGSHGHTVSGGSHTHAFNAGSHNHTFSGSASHTHTGSVGNHNHSYVNLSSTSPNKYLDGGGNYGSGSTNTGSTTPTLTVNSTSVSISGNTGNGSVSGTTDAGDPGVTLATTGVSGTTGSASLSAGSGGFGSGTNAPYVQLLACERV